MMAEEEDTRRYALGYRFYPFDQELITGYLKAVILGKRLPCNTIHFRQVYGPSSHPWLVFDPNDPSWLTYPFIKSTEKCMFVFTKLSKLSKNTTFKNTSKKAGCGTWVGRTKREQIRDGEGNVIGERRYLVFEIQETDSAASGVGFDLRKIGTYRMHEYSLSGINKGLDSADTIVLCRVTHDSSKACQINVSRSSKISSKVSTSNRQVEKKEESNNHLEGTASVTEENLIDGSVGNLSGATQLNNGDHELDDFCRDWCLDDLVGQEPCFEEDWLTRYLDFDQQEGPVEDSSVLGKRKSEEEGSSYWTKKICI